MPSGNANIVAPKVNGDKNNKCPSLLRQEAPTYRKPDMSHSATPQPISKLLPSNTANMQTCFNFILSRFRPAIRNRHSGQTYRFDCLNAPRLKRTFTLIVLFVYGFNSFADSPSQAQVAKVNQLLIHGDFAAAAALAVQNKKLLGNEKQSKLVLTTLLQLAEAHKGLGEYESAAKILKTGYTLANQQNDVEATATMVGALGSIEIALGSLELAQQHLNSAIEIADSNQSPELMAIVYNDLGNLLSVQNRNNAALGAYNKSILASKTTNRPLFTARTLANAGGVNLKLKEYDQAMNFLAESASLAKTLDDSHSKIYLLINISRNLQRLQNEYTQVEDQKHAALDLLNQATESADRLDDALGKSYALGFSGGLYERDERYSDALDLTVQAIFQSQLADSRPAYYLWEWQRGRLLSALGRRSAAIAAYKNAVRTLQSLRYRMSTGYGSNEAAFRENVGPIYLELVNLLLNAAEEIPDPKQAARYRSTARDTVELLKTAELRNYFRDDCVDALLAKVKSLEHSATSAAIIYPILLEDRLELLVTLPGDDPKNFSVPVSKTILVNEIRRFRRLLEKRTTNEYRIPGLALYRWLIEPIEPELVSANINTLIFVPGGALGTIPMSALYDGKRFLIEKFAVGITPGLSLTDPQAIQSDQEMVLMGGISKPVQGFPALRHVVDELNNVQNTFGGTQLLDEQFRSDKLKTALKSKDPSVLHISTHGKFEKNVEESFILTYDSRLTMRQLADYIGLLKFRENPLELLVLSACETAQGDDRAALGLSGIAVKAGARSAIGTLWKVHDAAAAELVGEFYQQLHKPRTSRATAVQLAQLKLISDIRYRHPGYWSAFLLINSWL